MAVSAEIEVRAAVSAEIEIPVTVSAEISSSSQHLERLGFIQSATKRVPETPSSRWSGCGVKLTTHFQCAKLNKILRQTFTIPYDFVV